MRLDQQIDFLTPAKVNFFLFVHDKRPDGYHELILDLIPISLYDKIEFYPSPKNGIELETNLPQVSPQDNLIVKAIRLLEERTNQRFSLNIRLCKVIPTGAGLGGGSGNAAGTLVVLNQFFKLGLSAGELRDIALKLGADVPFFIRPKPAVAKGIGEKLTFIPSFAPCHLLILFPNFSSSTSEAYARCNISARKTVLSDYSLGGLKKLTPDMNDFWEYLTQKFPKLEEFRWRLLGENAVSAGLSGSGSSLYGIFPDINSREQALARLTSPADYTLFPCATLGDHQYL